MKHLKKEKHLLKVGLAQIAPVWLDKDSTLDRIVRTLVDGGEKGCELVVFGEGLLPTWVFCMVVKRKLVRIRHILFYWNIFGAR